MLKPFYHKKNCLSSLLAPCCAPFFGKRKTLADFFSSFSDNLTNQSSRRRRRDAPCRFLNALVQIPVVKYRKTKTDKRVCLSVLFGGETGICLIAERVSLLTKAERLPGEPGFTPQAARCAPHRAKFLFRSIEKQGFVLAFCKASRVKYFYALQKSSGSR